MSQDNTSGSKTLPGGHGGTPPQSVYTQRQTDGSYSVVITGLDIDQAIELMRNLKPGKDQPK